MVVVSFFNISIHALLAESDVTTLGAGSVRGIFLSTLSLRRATRINRNIANGQSHFYPRSPCGERPAAWRRSPSMPPFLSTLSLRRATRRGVLCYLDNIDFYPRSPCGERHLATWKPHYLCGNFYPRSPCGERRWLRCWQLAARDISIHALLAESDPNFSWECKRNPENFYPRSPCGERQQVQADGQHRKNHFYPRSPCGERP